MDLGRNLCITVLSIGVGTTRGICDTPPSYKLKTNRTVLQSAILNGDFKLMTLIINIYKFLIKKRFDKISSVLYTERVTEKRAQEKDPVASPTALSPRLERQPSLGKGNTSGTGMFKFLETTRQSKLSTVSNIAETELPMPDEKEIVELLKMYSLDDFLNPFDDSEDLLYGQVTQVNDGRLKTSDLNLSPSLDNLEHSSTLNVHAGVGDEEDPSTTEISMQKILHNFISTVDTNGENALHYVARSIKNNSIKSNDIIPTIELILNNTNDDLPGVGQLLSQKEKSRLKTPGQMILIEDTKRDRKMRNHEGLLGRLQVE